MNPRLEVDEGDEGERRRALADDDESEESAADKGYCVPPTQC